MVVYVVMFAAILWALYERKLRKMTYAWWDESEIIISNLQKRLEELILEREEALKDVFVAKAKEPIELGSIVVMEERNES